MSYKLHINSYLTAIRKKQLDVVAAQKSESAGATQNANSATAQQSVAQTGAQAQTEAANVTESSTAQLAEN